MGTSTKPRVSLCQLSMVDTDFAGDVAVATRLGIDGLGVIEMKVGDQAFDCARLLEKASLEATICATNVLTLLPRPGEPEIRFSGPADPDARLEAMAQGMRNIAAVRPEVVFFVTGPKGEYSEVEARSIAIDALRALSDVADEMGTKLAIEPMREEARSTSTLVCSLAETLDLIEETGRDVGIVFDTWHMWDSADVYQDIPKAADRLFGVQIADYREPNRGPRDRVAAGDGVADLARMTRELRAAGFEGWYDLEVFSDDGRFGIEYPDSLWKLPPDEFVRVQLDGFLRCWDDA